MDAHLRHFKQASFPESIWFCFSTTTERCGTSREDVDWLTTRHLSRVLLLFPLSCTPVAVPQRREVFQASQCPRHRQVVVLLPQAITRCVYPPTSPPSSPTFRINSRRFVSSASFDPKISLIGLQWTRNALGLSLMWWSWLLSHTSTASTNIATELRLGKSRCDSTISSNTSKTLGKSRCDSTISSNTSKTLPNCRSLITVCQKF
jgi:hypothetical protein